MQTSRFDGYNPNPPLILTLTNAHQFKVKLTIYANPNPPLILTLTNAHQFKVKLTIYANPNPPLILTLTNAHQFKVKLTILENALESTSSGLPYRSEELSQRVVVEWVGSPKCTLVLLSLDPKRIFPLHRNKRTIMEN